MPDWIATPIIGGVIGWLASIWMRANGQMGILANVIVGIVGSYLGIAIANALGVQANTTIAAWIVAFLGAAVLIGILRVARGLFEVGGESLTMENEMSMSVAKVSDIVSELTKTATASLNEAIDQRIDTGNKTLRNLRVWWIKQERVTNGSCTQCHVNMMIGFVIDD